MVKPLQVNFLFPVGRPHPILTTCLISIIPYYRLLVRILLRNKCPLFKERKSWLCLATLALQLFCLHRNVCSQVLIKCGFLYTWLMQYWNSPPSACLCNEFRGRKQEINLEWLVQNQKNFPTNKGCTCVISNKYITPRKVPAIRFIEHKLFYNIHK